MSSAYLCVGCKFGDIISILPVLYQESLKGERPRLVIAKEYASVLKGVTYVTPVVYDGQWHDLKGALKFAKQKFDKVISLATFGSNMPIEHRTPSFQLDAWQRAGVMDKFHEWPLVFDRRSKKREAALCLTVPPLQQPIPQKFILIGDGGQSSPFMEIDDLIETVRSNFPSYWIVRLSEVKAEFIYDLLGLYDRAAALITTETVHIHLSAASTVPVLALVTDKPEKWHGSAYHPRFKFHCRYAEYGTRKPELIKAIYNAVNNVQPIKTQLVQDTYTGAYNPSIFRHGDKLLMTYRFHPASGTDAKSTLAICELSSTLKIKRNWPIIFPPALAMFSIEDGRLFNFRGKLYLSFVKSMWHNRNPACCVEYGELVFDSGVWGLINPRQIRVGKNDMTGMEKNFIFFEQSDRLFCIYGSKDGNQMVLEIEGENVVRTFESPLPPWDFGTIHAGTTPVPYNGRLLRFFHSRTENAPKPVYWRYYIGVCLMSPEPPFQIGSIQSFPILAGDECWNPHARFWKSRVVFPAGCVADNGKFLLSYGRNDCECRIATIDLNGIL